MGARQQTEVAANYSRATERTTWDPSPVTIEAVRQYELLLEELLTRRDDATIDEDLEEKLITAMNDCRSNMTPDEEASLEEIVTKRTGAR